MSMWFRLSREMNKKKDENHSINLNHPFLKFDSIFFVNDWLSECIRMDSSVQYPFNAWCCQTSKYSQRLPRQSFQTTFHIHFICSVPSEWNDEVKENAHVSIEIKPFDFFCSSLFFIFYCLDIFSVQMFVLSLKLTYEMFLSVEYHYEPLLSSFLHLFICSLHQDHLKKFFLWAICSHKVLFHFTNSISSNNNNKKAPQWKKKPECVLARLVHGMCKRIKG